MRKGKVDWVIVFLVTCFVVGVVMCTYMEITNPGSATTAPCERAGTCDDDILWWM